MILQSRRLHKEGREIIFVLTDVLVNSVIFWSPEAREKTANTTSDSRQASTQQLFWVPGSVLWVPGIVFWVFGIVFGVSGIVFWAL